MIKNEKSKFKFFYVEINSLYPFYQLEIKMLKNSIVVEPKQTQKSFLRFNRRLQQENFNCNSPGSARNLQGVKRGALGCGKFFFIIIKSCLFKKIIGWIYTCLICSFPIFTIDIFANEKIEVVRHSNQPTRGFTTTRSYCMYGAYCSKMLTC